MLQPSRPAETFKLKSLLAPLTTYQPSPQLSLSLLFSAPPHRKQGPFIVPLSFQVSTKSLSYIYFFLPTKYFVDTAAESPFCLLFATLVGWKGIRQHTHT